MHPFSSLPSYPRQSTACMQKARSSALEIKVWDGLFNGLTFPPLQPTLPLWDLLFLASVYPYLQKRALWCWSPAFELIKLGSFRKMESLKIQAVPRCRLYHAVLCLGMIYRHLITHMNDFSLCWNPGLSLIHLGSIPLILMHQPRIWSQTAEGWR